jgi:methylmalonyl-CoA/ethylmalonyl-CoA epimerase
MLERMTFHHVGIVTGDLLAAARIYRSLAYTPSEVFSDPIQKVKIILMRREGGPLIELIEPAEESSPAHAWLKRIKAGPYHTCYSTPDIEQTADALSGLSFLLLSAPVPAAAFHGKRACFLWSPEIGLLELLGD